MPMSLVHAGLLCGLSLHKDRTCLHGWELLCAAALLSTDDVSLYLLPLALKLFMTPLPQ